VPEIDFLIDTDVTIECFSGSPNAGEWLSKQEPLTLGIPYVVALEVLIGARNAREMTELRRQLGRFALVLPEPHDGVKAMELFADHHLRDGVGSNDCLLGALASRIAVPLYTFNVKHLGVLEGVDARRPYAR
jgi:predicted nucleic acid-binding protein